ncbi:hypothetical protein [Rhizobacter sp. SG703]|uniref:hypothetical protein n=1 Tax=Rhizobacter sp. SG703 TaxID=2587140 RepID=UPI001444F2C3|nr:hypothetical protein [Rhizobacter sp. SG703]NKI93286.1 hypothetical protein [Rhizobacter sp. SG703]
MGFLDDLKRQADALKSKQTEDTATLARNAALVEAACKTTWHYWMDLAQQLNVLLPTAPVRFSLDKVTALEGLKRRDFRVDARRKQHRGQEVFDHVVIHAQQTSGRKLTLNKDFPPEIERLESRLRQAGIAAETEWIRHPDNGRLEQVRFSFIADVVLTLRLLPDHDEGKLAFQLMNLDGLETVTATFAAFQVTSALLDQLARGIVGEPNDFLKLAESVRRVEA